VAAKIGRKEQDRRKILATLAVAEAVPRAYQNKKRIGSGQKKSSHAAAFC